MKDEILLLRNPSNRGKRTGGKGVLWRLVLKGEAQLDVTGRLDVIAARVHVSRTELLGPALLPLTRIGTNSDVAALPSVIGTTKGVIQKESTMPEHGPECRELD